MVVALHDAATGLPDVVGQSGLRVPARLGRRPVPHHHGKTEQRGALDHHAFVRLRHLPSAHVAKDRAVPIARGRAQHATGEVLVLFVTCVPLKLSELPVRDGHVCATFRLAAIIAGPSAIADGRDPRHRLVNLGDHVPEGRLLLECAANRRIPARGELPSLRRAIREELAACAIGKDGLLARVVLAAPLATSLRGAGVHRHCDWSHVGRSAGRQPNTGQVHAKAHGLDVRPSFGLQIRRALHVPRNDGGCVLGRLVRRLRRGLGAIGSLFLRLPGLHELVCRCDRLHRLRDVLLGLQDRGLVEEVRDGLRFRVGDLRQIRDLRRARGGLLAQAVIGRLVARL
mmetsp:Transcript_4371/g.12171  ORF Transcript_4371/g.12171 Transcript_4371/m.12171 type:complete len:342 (+) Transcript_4371:64-1089(+)